MDDRTVLYDAEIRDLPDSHGRSTCILEVNMDDFKRAAENSCTFEGCGKRTFAAHLCRGHYDQKRKGAELRPLKDTGPGKGRHMRVVRLRLTAKTISALGPHLSSAARRILETVTGTGPDPSP